MILQYLYFLALSSFTARVTSFAAERYCDLSIAKQLTQGSPLLYNEIE